MHALISGVGGFVGGALARAFLETGAWRVTGISRNRTPGRLAEHPNFRLVSTDLTRCEGLPARYDHLVHCAAEVPATCADEDELYRRNVEGTGRLLDHAASAGARVVVYMSSMAVYGTISTPVVDEETEPAQVSVYGRSKARGEELLAHWASKTSGAAAALRLPGVVGTGGRNNFLCDVLLGILAGQPIVARNPQALFNNVVHADDLAAFVVSLADRLAAGPTTLTLAASEPLSIRDVLARLYLRAGRKEQIHWTAAGGSPFLIAFERARALGYRPATVADSIDRFVAQTLAEQNAAEGSNAAGGREAASGGT